MKVEQRRYIVICFGPCTILGGFWSLNFRELHKLQAFNLAVPPKLPGSTRREMENTNLGQPMPEVDLQTTRLTSQRKMNFVEFLRYYKVIRKEQGVLPMLGVYILIHLSLLHYLETSLTSQ